MESESRANQPSLPPILDSMGWIQRAVLERLVGLLADSGFPEVRLPQANLLTSIPPDTGARMGELAARLRITPGALTQLVAQLEGAGLLRREPHPRDGRGVTVRPTARALRGYEIAREWTIELYDSWNRLAGDRRWNVFLEVLSEIAAHEQGRARDQTLTRHGRPTERSVLT